MRVGISVSSYQKNDRALRVDCSKLNTSVIMASKTCGLCPRNVTNELLVIMIEADYRVIKKDRTRERI